MRFLALFFAVLALLSGEALPKVDRADTGMGGVRLQPFFGGQVQFSRPVYFAEIPGALGHYLVLEQHTGSIVEVTLEKGKWVKRIFLRLAVNAEANEMGLLGFAFHPQFSENRKYYVNYNPPSGKETVVEERLAKKERAVDSGEGRRILLRVSQPYPNHNGGTLAFGPKDGMLYIGMGDGGSAGDPENHAQDSSSLLGKFLRIEVSRGGDAGMAYRIPSDNPFVGRKGWRGEIYALGLRNPWKWSFDALTERLWAGDVGQNEYEEISLIEAGHNYGWRVREGMHCYQAKACTMAGLTEPVWEYSHDQGFSVTGGYVYRGNKQSPFYGKLVVGDYGTRKIWALSFNDKTINDKKIGSNSNVTLSGPPEYLLTCERGIASFGVDLAGHLYVVAHEESRETFIYRMVGKGL